MNTPEAEALAIPPQKTDIALKEPQAGKLSRLAAFTPTNLTEAIALANLIAKSELAPKDYKGKAANVLIAMQMGAEVGLAPMAALQNIAIINGRPSLWGDAALGIVQVHPKFEGCKEEIRGEGDNRAAFCTVKRKGEEPHTASFSIAQAKKAQLWTKQGPWQTYPERMLAMRARGFALRDKFADALRGLILAEEAMDIPPDMSPAKSQRETATLDIMATLTPSTEPNRGHGNEGMGKPKPDQPDAKPEPTMCGECRQIDKHDETCSQFAKAEQDRRTSQTTKALFAVLGVVKKTQSKTDEPYLVLDVFDNASNKGKLYVWHKTLHEYLDVPMNDKRMLLCEISEQKKGNSTYHQLEHILELDGVPFVNNKPAQQAEMPTEDEGPDEPENPVQGVPGLFNK